MLVGEQRHQRGTHLAHQRADAVLAADVLHVHHHHLDGAQHHRRVAVLQARLDTLDDCLRLTLVARLVARQTVQDVHLTPLRGLVQRHHQLLQHRRADLQHLARRVVLNLAQRRHGVRHHRGVLVRDHVVQRVDEALLLHQRRADIVQLADAHRSRLAHVRIRVRDAGTQRLRQVLGDLLHVDAAHGTHGQGTDQRVLIRRVADERLHGQQSQIGLLVGVVDQVQIDQLLHLNVSLLHAVDDIDEQLGHILVDGHQRDNLLQGVLLVVDSVRGKLLLQLRQLIYKISRL